MGSKNKKQRKGGAGEGSGGAAAVENGKQMITDPRFASAHTDPRFRTVPRRESKVAIDSRFQRVFTDKRFATGSAPVDKRGKRRRGGSGKDSLREFYRIDEEEDKKQKKKRKGTEDRDGDSEKMSGDESESEKEDMGLKPEGKLDSSEEESSGAESEEEPKIEKKLSLKSRPKLDSSDEESDEEDDEAESEEVSEEEVEVDTDEDGEDIFEDGPELVEENIPDIDKETHRLAIVNMDWRHVSAKDLYVVLNSFLPKEGRIVSVAVYPSEFGLERMKDEEIHGPKIDGDEKNEDDDEEEEEEEDEDVINQKLRAYEISRLKYYYAVVECDSVATADYLYKSCDGIEFERSSNKLDLRFIPDSMEFKHPPRDVATEAPAGYEGLDFQSRALQLSKVNLSWDEDEPHRMKTLNQKFNADQLAELELKEFLASDESESDDDDNDEANLNKEEKRKQKYRALFESEDVVDSDKDDDDNDKDMEVTFNTGLEDLSKHILGKKDKQSETVWESYLRQRREKKRARKSKQNDDSSSDDDDDYHIDRKAMKGNVDDDGDDDFFAEEPPVKKKKEGKTKKKASDEAKKEEVAAEEKSRAELELLLADENAGEGLRGYNIKRKGKKGRTDMAEEKIPAAELNDPRFSALFSSPLYALDPTDPQFKRSATYARQIVQKQKEDPKSLGGYEESKANTTTKVKADGNLGSKKEKYELSSAIKSVKMKIQQKDSEEKQAAKAESSLALSQRVKKKAKALSKNV